jgi:methionine synthase II (cobalamin-independent)
MLDYGLKLLGVPVQATHICYDQIQIKESDFDKLWINALSIQTFSSSKIPDFFNCGTKCSKIPQNFPTQEIFERTIYLQKIRKTKEDFRIDVIFSDSFDFYLGHNSPFIRLNGQADKDLHELFSKLNIPEFIENINIPYDYFEQNSNK